MILRELLYKGSQVPTGCYQNFYKIFYQKRTTFEKKNIKKIIYGEVFHWFVLLAKLINY